MRKTKTMKHSCQIQRVFDKFEHKAHKAVPKPPDFLKDRHMDVCAHPQSQKSYQWPQMPDTGQPGSGRIQEHMLSCVT